MPRKRNVPLPTAEELKEIIIQVTYEYTHIYFETHKVQELDKQLWAALHMGIVTGLTLMGYDKDLAMQGVEMAIDELATDK